MQAELHIAFFYSMFYSTFRLNILLFSTSLYFTLHYLDFLQRTTIFMQRATKAYIDEKAFPKVLYLQAQRWGSALPAPTNVGGRNHQGRKSTTTRVMDVDYETEVPPLVRAPTPGQEEQEQQQTDGQGPGNNSDGGSSKSTSGVALAPVEVSSSNEGKTSNDFAADDQLRLYYCGDFVSQQPPGFEAAALSAAACAAHITRTL
jgi:hypothetical protein